MATYFVAKSYSICFVTKPTLASSSRLDSWQLAFPHRVTKTSVQRVIRELKQRRFRATDVNRKFMFLLLASFHAQLMSYKPPILAFTR